MCGLEMMQCCNDSPRTMDRWLTRHPLSHARFIPSCFPLYRVDTQLPLQHVDVSQRLLTDRSTTRYCWKQPCPWSSRIVKHFSFTAAELEWTRLLRRPAPAGPYLFCCKADKAKKPICLVNILCVSLPDTRACKHIFEWQWEQEQLPLLYRWSAISLWFPSYRRCLDHACPSLCVSDVCACHSLGPLPLQYCSSYFTLQ